MKINLFFLAIVLVVISCDNSLDDRLHIRHLDDYLTYHEDLDKIEPLAFAANNKTNTSATDIYCYLETDADFIYYFETSSIDVDPTDFTQYKLTHLQRVRVFGENTKPLSTGFVKHMQPTSQEAWCIVGYEADNKLYISSKIRLKQQSQPTVFSDALNIDNSNVALPIISWEKGAFDNTTAYLELVTDNNIELISATITEDLFYKYNDDSNVIKTISPVTAPIISANTYSFSVLGIGNDNWVNLWIDKNYVP